MDGENAFQRARAAQGRDASRLAARGRDSEAPRARLSYRPLERGFEQAALEALGPSCLQCSVLSALRQADRASEARGLCEHSSGNAVDSQSCCLTALFDGVVARHRLTALFHGTGLEHRCGIYTSGA
jgi:hypothetical protein